MIIYHHMYYYRDTIFMMDTYLSIDMGILYYIMGTCYDITRFVAVIS